MLALKHDLAEEGVVLDLEVVDGILSINLVVLALLNGLVQANWLSNLLLGHVVDH